jgi:hypothetical protein
MGAIVALTLPSACATSVEVSEQDDGVAPDAAPDAHHPNTTPDSGQTILPDGGSADALPDYVDPGCPEVEEPTPVYDCDPYDQGNGDCAPNEGCYIYVQYPSEPCGIEFYGAVCNPAGPGVQGDECWGGQDCGGGFACVISGSGNQCVKLCKLEGSSGCSAGLVCEPIDVEGFGGCL